MKNGAAVPKQQPFLDSQGAITCFTNHHTHPTSCINSRRQQQLEQLLLQQNSNSSSSSSSSSSSRCLAGEVH
ncbi:hypothetical protein ACSSS7_006486 [Eimeria intestinalis]